MVTLGDFIHGHNVFILILIMMFSVGDVDRTPYILGDKYRRLIPFETAGKEVLDFLSPCLPVSLTEKMSL